MRAFEMIYRDEVSAKAVSVFRYLLDRQGSHEYCFVSHRRMAGDLKISVSTVKRALTNCSGKGMSVWNNAGAPMARSAAMSTDAVIRDELGSVYHDLPWEAMSGRSYSYDPEVIF